MPQPNEGEFVYPGSMSTPFYLIRRAAWQGAVRLLSRASQLESRRLTPA